MCASARKNLKSSQLFSHLSPYEQSFFGMRVHIFGEPLYLAGSKNSRDELMIIVTNKSPKNAIACYLRRWEIETMFSALKNKGWRFEDTHITKPARIEKLIALMAIGFVWAHKIGEWEAKRKPIPLKNLEIKKDLKTVSSGSV